MFHVFNAIIVSSVFLKILMFIEVQLIFLYGLCVLSPSPPFKELFYFFFFLFFFFGKLGIKLLASSLPLKLRFWFADSKTIAPQVGLSIQVQV